MTSEQRLPVNSGHSFWVPMVVIVHRFDCFLLLCTVATKVLILILLWRHLWTTPYRENVIFLQSFSQCTEKYTFFLFVQWFNSFHEYSSFFSIFLVQWFSTFLNLWYSNLVKIIGLHTLEYKRPKSWKY